MCVLSVRCVSGQGSKPDLCKSVLRHTRVAFGFLCYFTGSVTYFVTLHSVCSLGFIGVSYEDQGSRFTGV